MDVTKSKMQAPPADHQELYDFWLLAEHRVLETKLTSGQCVGDTQRDSAPLFPELHNHINRWNDVQSNGAVTSDYNYSIGA